MAGEINTQTQVIPQLLPYLHADSVADLTFWTQADLINWMDEGCKRLARVAGCWVEVDTSITTSNRTALYPLPERQDTTLYVSFGTAPLRPASMIELEMRSPTFMSDPGTPDHWYEDGQGWNIGLDPVPTTAVNVPLIMMSWPPTLDTGLINVLVQAPAPLAAYLSFYTLKCAYGREGESEMPDVAQHCDAMCDFFEEILTKYYGKGL